MAVHNGKAGKKDSKEKVIQESHFHAGLF